MERSTKKIHTNDELVTMSGELEKLEGVGERFLRFESGMYKDGSEHERRSYADPRGRMIERS